MEKYLKIFLVIIFVIALCAVIFFAVFSKNSEKDGLFTIKRGENFLQISANLKHQGFISSQLKFIFDSIISGNWRNMKAGKYKISKNHTNLDLISQFVKMQTVPVNILIIPGGTTKTIAQTLSANGIVKSSEFLNYILTPQPDLQNQFPFLTKNQGLEGYLFPDSYLIDQNASPKDIAKQMLENFEKKIEPILPEVKKSNKNLFQIITIASMLEKEVKTYQDKQIVAGILWKRADNNLPLQVDSTLLYFQTSEHPSLLDKDVDSPYNTYNRSGLPKGPISNPGFESIKAAIYPEKTNYWFYLSAKDGTTIFSKTLGEHLINKAKYLK